MDENGQRRNLTRKQWTALGALHLALLGFPEAVERHGLLRELPELRIAFAAGYLLISLEYVVVRSV
jgi:hypothetical protein